jgi:hypothetical protein
MTVVYGPVVCAPSYRCCWGADPNNGGVLLAGGQVTAAITYALLCLRGKKTHDCGRGRVKIVFQFEGDRMKEENEHEKYEPPESRTGRLFRVAAIILSICATVCVRRASTRSHRYWPISRGCSTISGFFGEAPSERFRLANRTSLKAFALQSAVGRREQHLLRSCRANLAS